jgi:adenylate cyclase
VISVRRATLAQTFFVAALAIAVIVGVSFWLFLRDARSSILDFSERLRLTAAERVEGSVARALGTAEDALGHLARSLRVGALHPDDLELLEVALYTELADSPRLAEVTFVRADVVGYDASGEAELAPQGRFQLSLFRATGGGLVTRVTRQAEHGFVVQTRDRKPDDPFDAAPFVARGAGDDPTAHPTFTVPIAKQNGGRMLWSDLHYSELDLGQPNPRVVLSVQQSVVDALGHVIGVLRVALLTTDLDAISRLKVDPTDPNDPHQIALLAVSSTGAHDARLVARIGPKDHIELVGDDLRVTPDHPPPELAALLASPLVHGLDPKHPKAGGELRINGQRYLATLRELSVAAGGTEGWLVAVVVPEAHYTQDLVRFEHLFVLVFGATLAAVLLVGTLTLRIVQRSLGRLVKTTAQMRGFDFAPDAAHSRLHEIDELMVGLERAKTAVRAMGKYIPLDLVKRLYARNEEPQLGGELRTLSLMFTDIEGFTTLAEHLRPDQLARHLGDYLEAMTSAVEATSGTIDKYIGDAVMAFWNAPADLAAHAKHACAAVLACKERTQSLYASATWHDLPPLVTRFGLHTADVMVGNFGARSRLSYTALGDGVNLAARLEPLCKQYGVTVLVSEAIAAAARDEFVFRRVDRVAVKGKAQGIDVYELLGRQGSPIPNLPEARRYEAAFDAYLNRDFSGAAALLASAVDDPPSAVLHARCEHLKDAPPPPDWDGVHVAASK